MEWESKNAKILWTVFMNRPLQNFDVSSSVVPVCSVMSLTYHKHMAQSIIYSDF